jgi:5-methylcytosine-specific restriction endonuclease McrA
VTLDQLAAVGRSQKNWARKARQSLIEVLGGCCCMCKTSDSLEFDCIEPQGDEHHRMDTSARMSFYRSQFRIGNLQVLCSDCHSLKTAADRLSGRGDMLPVRKEVSEHEQRPKIADCSF